MLQAIQLPPSIKLSPGPFSYQTKTSLSDMHRTTGKGPRRYKRLSTTSTLIRAMPCYSQAGEPSQTSHQEHPIHRLGRRSQPKLAGRCYRVPDPGMRLCSAYPGLDPWLPLPMRLTERFNTMLAEGSLMGPPTFAFDLTVHSNWLWTPLRCHKGCLELLRGSKWRRQYILPWRVFVRRPEPAPGPG